MRIGITIWCCWRRTIRATANLMKIVSKGFVEGFYYKPRVDMEVLNRYHEGIIALSACLAGEVQRYLARGMYEEACRGGKEISRPSLEKEIFSWSFRIMAFRSRKW